MLKPVLLVEDNPKDLELTLYALDQSNLSNDVAVARDGAEALDYLACSGEFAKRIPGNPAVILLDIKLPKMDGLEVLRAVREHAEWKGIPVVMLTASNETADLAQTYELGVNAYVIKPVALRDFVAAVSGLGVFWGIINEPPPRPHRRG